MAATTLTTVAEAPRMSSPRLPLGGIVARLLVYGIPTLIILVPLVSFLAYSFLEQDNGALTGNLTFANYVGFFTSSSYLYVFFGTLKLAFIVALVALIFGYIISYLIWRLEGSARYLLLLLSALPLVMNYVVKIYAMRSILGFNGSALSTCRAGFSFSTRRRSC
jgi:spermidine/putrescine transport system permease protein